jgi:molybdenum cofactor biosynthesis enzyme
MEAGHVIVERSLMSSLDDARRKRRADRKRSARRRQRLRSRTLEARRAVEAMRGTLMAFATVANFEAAKKQAQREGVIGCGGGNE